MLDRFPRSQAAKTLIAILGLSVSIAACGQTLSPSAPLLATNTPSPPTTAPPTLAPSQTTTPTLTSTPAPTQMPSRTPHDVPPEIVVRWPSQAAVGERIFLDALETFDHDGDRIQYTWSQIHNPDQYDGLEYVTGNSVELENPEGVVAIFVPQWPGLYRFELTAKDDDGASKQIIDVLAHWSDETPFDIRSISFGQHIAEDLNYLPEIFARIAQSGANYVDIQTILHMDDPRSVEFAACSSVFSSDSPCHNYSDQDLQRVITLAREQGLKVLLSVVVVIPGSRAGSRALNPVGWDEWFRNYTDDVVRYAEIAEANDVALVAIGNELSSSHWRGGNWNQLIDEVEKVYSGELTYRDNQPVHFPETPIFPAWDRLDYMGINFLWAATGVSPGYPRRMTDPSVDLMIDSLEQRLDYLLSPLVENHNKPVLLTAVGPAGWDGANTDPKALKCDAEVDNQENVDYMEAVSRIAVERGWVGINATSLQPREVAWAPEGCNTVWDIRDKPIETLMALWFGTPTQGEQ